MTGGCILKGATNSGPPARPRSPQFPCLDFRASDCSCCPPSSPPHWLSPHAPASRPRPRRRAPPLTPGGEITRIYVEMTSFDFIPEDLEFSVGETVEFDLFSKDIEHDFTVEDLDIHWDVDGGERATEQNGLHVRPRGDLPAHLHRARPRGGRHDRRDRRPLSARAAAQMSRTLGIVLRGRESVSP